MKHTWLFICLWLLPAPALAGSLGTWKDLPPTPTARTEVAAAVLDGKIYLIGGFTPMGISDKVEVYDPGTGLWQKKVPLPRPLHHTTASVVEGKLYVIGGFFSGRWTAVNTTYAYDPETNEWTEKAPMPTARGALAAGVVDGKIHAVGGAHRELLGLTNTAAHEVYDPKTDKWTTMAPVPTPRDHLTISVWKGMLYAIGGRIDVNYHSNLDANEAYDPNTNTWEQRKPLPTARSGITSQAVNGRIFVFGGESGEGTFTENEAYDPKSNTWKTMTPMPEGRHGLASVVINGNIHLLNGGPLPGGGGSTTHRVFSPGK